MKRAVVMYVDHHWEQLLYFGCFYTSFKFIQSPNTDLIVFAPDRIHSLLPSDIIKISFTGSYPHYPYLHALEFFLDKKSDILDQYDFILRSEPDTFLTPAWNGYISKHFTAGRGKYVHSKSVQDNIKRIAKELGLAHQGVYNIGASHYAPPSLIREVSKLSIKVATYLLDKEFNQFEGSWPNWYRGVISMYSNEIAINHLVNHIVIDANHFDYDSTSASSISAHSHIHCWHTSEQFSKFSFAKNQYSPTLISSLNKASVKDYCLYIALKSIELLPIQKSLLSLAD